MLQYVAMGCAAFAVGQVIFMVAVIFLSPKRDGKPPTPTANHPTDLDVLAATVQRNGASLDSLEADIAAVRAATIPEVMTGT